MAAKLNSSGVLVWNTFLGGSGTDNGRRITVDGSGNVFVAGSSTATWGSPAQAYTSGTDAFAAELDSSGNRIWHTFVGGSGTDVANAIAIDGVGNVYLAGNSSSTWGSPVQSFASGQDAFVVKINPETTLSQRIAAASDDAEQEGPTGTTPNRMWLDSSDIELVSDFGSPTAGVQQVGLRFTGMNIPVGATITNAYLVFRAVSADSPMTNSDATNLTVHGQLTGNASTFTSTSGNISSRALTGASTAWSPTAWTTGLDYNSPDITSVIQEIVDQGTWASGNALALIISGTGHRAAQSYDSDPSNAAQLVITYTTATVNTPPTVVNSSVTANEDVPYVFTASSFGYSDLDGDPLSKIQITALPSVGQLKLNGVLVTLNQEISRANIDSGLLTYTGAQDASGTGYATFDYRAHDGTTYSNYATITQHLTGTFNSNADGFTYADQVNGSWANGVYDGAGGSSGGGLRIDLAGGVTGGLTSGAWTKTFNLTATTEITISTSYRLTISSEYESNEYGELALQINGTPYGNDVGSSLIRQVGDGNGGANFDSGWRTYQTTITLAAGTHTLSLIANNNDSTSGDEWATGYFDNVSVTSGRHAVMNIDVTAVNDAPVLDNTGTMSLTTITENGTISGWVSNVITSAGGNRITDIDAGAVEGIAITSVNNGNGTWRYSTDGGSSWFNVGPVSNTSALLLRANDFISYVGDSQNGGTADFQFRAWDQTSGTQGTKVDTSVNGGTSAFSTATETANITTTSVNDAPVLDNSGTMTLTTINEDQPTNSGNTVSSIILSAGGDRISDVDSGAVEGIAITSLVSGNGTWQFSTNAGGSWASIGDVSNASALLLRGTDLVRFVPNAQSGTTASFDFRSWDQTSGTAGTRADASVNGGTTAFSTSTETASIVVSDINDAPTFDSGTGLVTTGFAVGSTDFINAIAIQPDGKIIAVGYTQNAGNNDFAVVRYNADGSLDTSFGSGTGKVTTAIGPSSESAQSVVILSNGKILVAGSAIISGSWDIALVQYNADGSLDTSFGGGTGIATSGIAGSDEGFSLAVQSDGKILVAGGDNSNFLLARFLSNGSLDTSFGASGMVTTDFAGSNDRALSMSLQADGKILLGGYAFSGTSFDFAVARYNTDGTHDSTFNGTGKLMVDLGTNSDDSGRSLTLQPDGKILIAGWSDAGGTNDFGLARLNTNGSLDTTFNGTGKVTTPIGSGSDLGLNVTVQADGKILMVGQSSTAGNNFAAVRYNTNGSLDTTFNGTGKVEANFGGSSDDRGAAIAVQTDGKIVLAGTSTINGNHDFALARFSSTGTLDTQFNTSHTLGGTIAYTENAAAVVLDSNVTIFDAELSALNNFNGATLTLSRNGGASAQDLFSATGLLGALTQGGSLVYSGTTIGTVTTNSSGTLVLTFNSNATQSLVNSAMRLIGYSNSSDAPPASVQINWTFSDGNSGSQGTGGALTATSSTSVNITSVNDAPVLTPYAPAYSTTEDSAPLTVPVSSVIGSTIADVDSGAVQGIALTGLTGSAGTLTYSVDGGSSWQSVSSASPTTAILLRSTDLVRFQPNGQNGGAMTLSYRAWDQTSGTAGGNVDTTVNGGSTAFSTAEDTVSINVSSVNDEQVLSTNAGMTVLEGASGSVISTAMLQTTDVDNTASQLVYTVTSIPTNGVLQRNGINLSANSTFTQADIDGGLITYGHNGTETTSDSFAFSVDDGAGTTSSGTFNIAITLVDDNAPIITSNGGGAIASINVAENSTVVTTVTATDADLPSQTITYSIIGGTDQALFTIDGSTGVLAFISGRDRENHSDANLDGIYEVTVQASDGSFTDTQAISVTVTDVDEFDVGAVSDSNVPVNTVAENATVGAAVGITASASDADATNNTINYTLDDDSGGLFAIHATTGVVTVNGALDYETATSHNITVRATSSDGSFSTQIFTINVTDVNESGVSAISDSDVAANLVLENVSVGTVVGVTAFATDADGTDSVSYSLDDDAGGLFAIHATTGVVTVNGALDYETVTSHNITVRATSSDGSFNTQIFSINVNDVNESGVSAVSDSDATANLVLENVSVGTVVGVTAFATDADGTDSVSYSLDDNAGGLFTIHSTTGVVTVNGAIDREAASSYNITVRATSSDTTTTTQVFNIAIGDVDEFDVGTVSDSNVAANTVAENATVGTAVGITASAQDLDATNNAITYTLDDDAGGLFTIHATTGVVTVAGSLDYETATSHNITARATSSDGSFNTQIFSINVTDVNESGVSAVSDSDAAANYVLENSTVGSVVGVTGLATDADGSDSVSYSLDDDAGGRFAIHATTGVVTVNGAIDREAASSYNITVRATSTDTSSTTQVFNIAIGDVDEFDTGAVSDSNVTVNSVAENATVGTTVGITVTASDADATNNTINYTLDDDAGGLFTIHATTGVVTVNGALDYETATSHNITARATSSDGSSSTQGFTIGVTDINESGVSAVSDSDASANSVLENSTVGSVVGVTGLATDADGSDTVSYSLDDDAGGRFAIHATTGVVTVNGAIDREAASSYNITIRATSTDTTSTTQVFNIAIGDVDEFDTAAVIDSNLAANSVPENATVGTAVGITAAASDADATNNTITYTLDDDAGGLFAIHATTGVVTVNGAIDREAASSYNITVRATSSDTTTTTQVFNIAIGDVDEYDTGAVSDSNVAANSVAENATVGTAVGITASASDADATNNTINYTLDDDAGGLFTIHATTGVVTVNGTLDYETATSHNVTARATSSDGSSSTQGFTINVTDINESGVSAVSDSDATANSVLENSTVGSVVGVTGLATDADGSDTVSYSLDDDAGGRFAIHATTGVVTVNGAIDREAASSYNITVRATSTDTTSTTQVFNIAIGDVDEFDTVRVRSAIATWTANSVAENATVGTAVGITATSASDADATNNTINYTLDDDAGGLFAIHATTGVVTVNGVLDYETATSHNITARATSSDGSFNTQIFSINVTDVNESGVSPLATPMWQPTWYWKTFQLVRSWVSPLSPPTLTEPTRSAIRWTMMPVDCLLSMPQLV